MRQLIPLLFATAAIAAEGTPLVEVSMPDGARLRARVESSLYGQLWADPAFAPLRTRLEAKIAELKTSEGFDLPHWYGALVSAGLVVQPPAIAGEKPRAALLVNVGSQATDLFAAWRTNADNGTTPTTSPGADEAFHEPLTAGGRQLVARMGTLIASTSDAAPIPAWRPLPGNTDLNLRFDGPALGTVLGAQLAQGGEATATLLTGPALAAAYGRITYDLTIIPEGVHERIVTDAASPWLVPVERAVLDRLPANALNALAIGIDGKHLWAILRKPMLTLIAESDGLTIDDAETALDANLAGFGVTTGFAGLIEGIAGTITLAVTPSAPFPAVTLTLPRSAGIDQLITALTTQLGGVVPAAGTSSLLPIPGAPVLVNLACDAQHWLITSDAAAATGWLGGSASGWTTTPAATLALAKAGPGAVLIGASDTPTLVRTLTPFVALGLGQSDVEKPIKQAILQTLGRLAALAKSGYIVGRTRREGGVEVELRGVMSSSVMPLMVLGLVNRSASQAVDAPAAPSDAPIP